jgi:homoserine kinase type II
MAVYTQLSMKMISDLLSRYDLGEAMDAKGIHKGVENTNYLLTVRRSDGKDGRFILTVYEKRVRKSDLPFFMGLLEHLAARGVPCPRPVAARDGGSVQDVAGKPAALVTFLEGREVTKIEPEHLRALGGQMARMHLAAMDFAGARPNALSLPGWRELAARIGPGADTVAPGLAQVIAQEMRMLAHAWEQDLPQGIIHADLFPDNVFFEESRLTGLIDFYFSCRDYLMYDVAIVINAWCFERQREFNITKARALLRGYHAVRPIMQAELNHLPVLCRGAALRFLLTRAHDKLFPVAGAQVTPKDPMEYLRKLQFHQGVKGHGEYGL